MATVDITKQTSVDTSLDGVVIQKMIEDIPGGRSLGTSGISDDVIKAGHVIIQETATGEYKALGITSGAYVSLPSGHTYAGILYVSVLTAKPFASIMVRGTVNKKAAVDAAGLPSYPAGAITALSLIRFIEA